MGYACFFEVLGEPELSKPEIIFTLSHFVFVADP